MDPIVALEIGTSKTLALVGELRDGEQVVVTGMGSAPTVGVRKGEVVDIEKAVAGVKAAVSQAEDSGSLDVRCVHLVLTGGHIQGMVNRGTLALLQGGGEITREDVEQVMEIARSVPLPPDREILHSLCQFYTIDGGHRVLHPEGMEGAKLTLDMLILHCVRTRLRNVMKVAEQMSLEVSDVVFGGVCSATAVLSPEQKSGGVIMLDLGGGTTDYMAYADGAVEDAGVLPVGGDHVTNDIALAFDIPSTQAERLKCEAGCLPPAAGAPQRVALAQDMGFAARTVDAESLAAVVDARVNEILTVVRKRMERTDLRRMGAGVVLTGGGARMRGIATIAERVFEMPCAIAKPRNIVGLASAETPECSACAGLLQYALRTATEQKPASLTAMLKRLFGR